MRALFSIKPLTGLGIGLSPNPTDIFRRLIPPTRPGASVPANFLGDVNINLCEQLIQRPVINAVRVIPDAGGDAGVADVQQDLDPVRRSLWQGI